MILPFLRKTVTAGQVAVVGNMQAERLHHCGPVLKTVDCFFVHILCKQHLLFFEHRAFLKSSFNIFLLIPVFQGSEYLLLTFSLIQQTDHVVDNLIHHMHGTAIYIEYNVVSIIFITMNHSIFPFFS